jgi:hypothetical protein
MKQKANLLHARDRAKGHEHADYVRQCLTSYELWIDKLKLPDTERNLIEWDRTQNKKQLLDWDVARNVERGLLQQAHHILNTYRREYIAGAYTTMPTVWKGADGAYQKLATADADFRERVMEHWMREFETGYIRLIELGEMDTRLNAVIKGRWAKVREMVAERKRPPQSADEGVAASA